MACLPCPNFLFLVFKDRNSVFFSSFIIIAGRACETSIDGLCRCGLEELLRSGSNADVTVKELPLLSGDGHLVDCSGPMAKTDLKWGTEAGRGGRAGPLRRSRKGLKLTLEEGKVSLHALIQGRGAWLSRDGDWGDWGQGCRGHLADQLFFVVFVWWCWWW